MITSLVTLLSSGAVGSIFGLIGGYLNRRLDLEAKKLDYQHELKSKEMDKEFMIEEYKQKTQIAVIEGEAATEVAGYNAMSASYSYAPVNSNSVVDSFSKLIRPVVTLAFFLFSVYIFYTINSKISILILPASTLEKVYLVCIEWVLFQAGISIGWWFANRQSGPSLLKGK